MALCTTCGTDNPERAKFCLECGSALPSADETATGTRKMVTILFADVVGSTALGEHLDPETMRAALARYFGAARTVLERHGGSVEKFIGDAVMAVFGIPQLHEDDALRAVRAAIELRTEINRLNDELAAERRLRVEFRIGVNSGTVVAGGTDGSGTFVTGDPVNVAARLQQAAAAGDVLLGEATYRMVRDFVAVEAVAPIPAKGKTEELRALRLVGLAPGARAADAGRRRPFVGRRRELNRLAEALADAVADQRCVLFTLLGSAGVGKSRLVAEFLALHAAEARVLRGRCLPYGDGITFWPIAEIVRAAAGVSEEDTPGAVEERVAAVVASDPSSARVGELLASMLGLSTANAPPEERFWAVRRFLEAQARDQPLVCLIEDIHWAEPNLLELLENVADWTRGASIVLLCTARPELLEARPTWGGGKVNATTLLLEPLPADSTRELVDGLLGDAELPPALVERILVTAEGNPLYAEEIVRMLTEDGGGPARGSPGEIRIPTSVQAVIAARLDRLPAPERAVAERAAVAGRVFERSAVLDLVREDQRDRVPGALLALMRKELVQPSQPDLTGDEAFRFRHMLIRDTAYESLPKQERADLHERFAGWLERTAGDRLDEYAEIVAYHLEQALRYRHDLGLEDTRSVELAEKAGQRLCAAGSRAYLRRDLEGAIKLLQRAVSLLPLGPDRRDALVMQALSADTGNFYDVATTSAEQLRAEGAAAGDRVAEWKGRLIELTTRMESDPAFLTADAEAPALEALAVFEEAGDEQGMAIACMTLARLYLGQAQWHDSTAAAERGADHAQRAGDHELLATLQFFRLNGALWGSMPVTEVLRLADELIAGETSTVGRAAMLQQRAFAHALAGDIDRARADVDESLRLKCEVGDPERQWVFSAAPVEFVFGNFDAADESGRATAEAMERAGETGARSTIVGLLAHIALDSSAPDEHVLELAQRCRELAAADDVVSQAQWRLPLAIVAARQSRPDEARRLIAEAAEMADATDFLWFRGLVAEDRGRIEQELGQPGAAREHYQVALDYYELKGDVPDAARIRERLAGLATG